MRGKQKHSGKRLAAAKWYQEPRWVVECLKASEEFSGTIYDPACGGGVILNVFDQTHVVHGSDIIDRGFDSYPKGFRKTKKRRFHIRDFLADLPEFEPDNIICNPPFSDTVAFVRNGLAIAKQKVAMLARLDFLASQRRYWLFNETPVSHVIILSKRPSLPPAGMNIPASGGQHDYCWIVWTKNFRGKTRISWTMPDV